MMLTLKSKLREYLARSEYFIVLRDLNYAVARYIWYRRNSSAFLCYALGYS